MLFKLAIVALIFAGLYSLMIGYLWRWTTRLVVSLPYAEEHRLKTADGAIIELRRLPCALPVKERAPVLLVHGIGASHRNHDGWKGASLARYLSERGSDVWLVTLRSGLKGKFSSKLVRFSAMVEHDLPLAVREIVSRTGHSVVDYVGFSMGGMLLYAAINHSIPAAQLGKITIIGSPIRIKVPQFLRFTHRLPHRWLPRVRFQLWAKLSAWFLEHVPITPLHHYLYNPVNVAPGAARLALLNIVQDIPGAIQADFLEFSLNGGDIRVNGQSVLETLPQVQNPVLFLAGSKDRLGPPEALKLAFDAWGATNKTMVILGKAHGTEHDYGHGDLTFGKNVEREVFPLVERFLYEDEVKKEDVTLEKNEKLVAL